MNRYVIEYGPSEKAVYTLLVTAPDEAAALAIVAERLPGEKVIGIKSATVGTAPIAADEPAPEPEPEPTQAESESEDEEPAKWKRRK